jgi:hypothetical protein
MILTKEEANIALAISVLKVEFENLSPLERLKHLDKLKEKYCFHCGAEKCEDVCSTCRNVNRKYLQ